MNCSQIRWLLDIVMDDEIQGETSQAVFRHLDECRSCQSIWREYLSARETLREFRDRIEIPASLPAKIRDLMIANPNPGDGSTNKSISDVTAAITVVDLLDDEVIEIMAGLSPRERDVLRLRFGLDDGRQRTLEEVATLFGVRMERIRQIEAKALRKLRHPNRRRPHRDQID